VRGSYTFILLWNCKNHVEKKYVKKNQLILNPALLTGLAMKYSSSSWISQYITGEEPEYMNMLRPTENSPFTRIINSDDRNELQLAPTLHKGCVIKNLSVS
jgi:hypothetical protein